ncbi:MAG: D-2-hydroxyacid dehydrogenase [Gammaproteobacteria bacterium]
MFRILCGLILTLNLGASASAAGPDAATAQLIKDLGLREAEAPISASSAWQKPRRIVVTMLERQRASKPDAVAWLQQVAGDAEIVVTTSREVPAAQLEGADLLLGYCTHGNLKNGTALRYILNYSAGVDSCTSSPLAQARDILVTNMQRIYGPAIAEHAIGMMYMLTRKLYVFRDRQLAQQWDRAAVERTSMQELQGRTLLVVGLGGIGTEIARRAHGLGMRVLATRNSSREGPDFVAYVGLPDELSTLAGQADVVINATPLTVATTGLFDRSLFSKMKPGAYFINVGRGRSVVTADLIEALNSDRLGGAALDVTDPEPLPPDHPLWTAKNIFITPHISAGSDEQMGRYWLVVRENLRRYVNGERMLSVVDLKRGY